MSSVLTTEQKECIDNFTAPLRLMNYALYYKILLKETFLKEQDKKRKIEESMTPEELFQYKLEISNKRFKKPVRKRS